MLAIAANSFDKPSETFIRAHVTHIAPGRTVLICRQDGGAAQFGCPVLADVEAVPGHLREHLRQGMHKLWRSYVDPAMDARDEARVRAFFEQHGVTVVLAEFGRTGARLRRACKRAGVPLFVHFHGSDATKRARSPRWRRHYQRLFRDAAGVIAPSQFLAGRLRDLGCPERKLHVSPCGIELRRQIEQPERSKVLLAVGRLVEKKSPLNTLRAFAKVSERDKDVVLELVGDGPLMKNCRSEADRLGIAERVHFRGAVPHEEVDALMRNALAFVQHSVEASDGDCEGLPVAILEAMSHELPVVSTRHSGIPEAVADGETGLLVEEHDVDGMATAIFSLLDDPERAEAMGRAGRARVEARFTHGHTAARLREIMGLTL
jgi:glycosyltransferase involved in cell wall biosynthesis